MEIKNNTLIGASTIATLLLTGSISAQAEPSVEPPTNQYLADSAWPMSHRNPYNQASSPYPGISPIDVYNGNIEVDIEATIPVSITVPFSSSYNTWTGEERRAAWASTALEVIKMEMNGDDIQRVQKIKVPASKNPLSGAYSIVDSENDFFVPRDLSIHKYDDRFEKAVLSKFKEAALYTVPAELTLSPDDFIVGMNITFDGHIVFATAAGLIGALDRDFESASYTVLGDGGIVSNSIAVDEEGGIFIVTSKQMHRVQWTGTELSRDPAVGAWTSDYDIGPEIPLPGRLGTGSGSTPTLMGTGAQDDKFVVFTDGQELMNLVLMWRDEIPADWEPIAPGKDRRIAAEIPVTYGNTNATSSMSEQSVLVRGYSAVVVNNEYGDAVPPQLSVLLSNMPGVTPYGMEKFTWNPEMNTGASEWANPTLSCPNGIPTMSEATNLIYCIGARQGAWTLEGTSWVNGQTVFALPLGGTNPLIAGAPTWNSYYAATQVAENGDIVTGTYGGIVRIHKKQ